MNDKEFLIKYENLLNKGYCDCNEMNCIDNNSPRRILNIAIKQQKEIDRLNNIINELEKYLKENIKLTKTAVHFEILDDYDTRKYKRDIALFEMVLDKLKELKDSDK